jgi:hypothetical protein
VFFILPREFRLLRVRFRGSRRFCEEQREEEEEERERRSASMSSSRIAHGGMRALARFFPCVCVCVCVHVRKSARVSLKRFIHKTKQILLHKSNEPTTRGRESSTSKFTQITTRRLQDQTKRSRRFYTSSSVRVLFFVLLLLPK